MHNLLPSLKIGILKCQKFVNRVNDFRHDFKQSRSQKSIKTSLTYSRRLEKDKILGRVLM